MLTCDSSSLSRVDIRSLNKNLVQRYQAVTGLLDDLRSATGPATQAECADVEELENTLLKRVNRYSPGGRTTPGEISNGSKSRS